MQILVSGKQLDVGDVLQSHVDERLQSRITNNFSNSMDAHVVFSKEGHDSRTDLLAHVGPCINTQARADTSDIYATFDKASDRLEIWLHRYKPRLQDKHGHERPASEDYVAQNFVPAVEPEAEEAPEEFQPVGVGGHATDIHRRTAGEADMQLDIAEQPVLMFRNIGDSHLNVVYSRPDSHMGWINSVMEFYGQEP